MTCRYDPATRGGDAPDGRKVKSTLHWVAADTAIRRVCSAITTERPDTFHSSRCQRFQAIFVMQSRQDRGRHHVVTSRDLMSVWPREPAWQRVGEIRAEARMWSALVVESPTLAGSKDVVHSGRSANPSSRTDGSNHPLAEGIRLWRSHWRLQHRQPHRRDCVVDGSGKDGSRSWMRNRWG